MDDPEKPCSSKPQQRDWLKVLRSPVEVAPQRAQKRIKRSEGGDEQVGFCSSRRLSNSEVRSMAYRTEPAQLTRKVLSASHRSVFVIWIVLCALRVRPYC